MDFGIIDFCLQNTPFFDIGTGASRDYELVSSDLPAGWVRILDSTWCYLNPLAVDTVEQGWKIPVSYTHLDVYKRQPSGCGRPRSGSRPPPRCR